MGSNELLIGASIAGFFVYYYYDQKQVKRNKKIQVSVEIPQLHTDSFTEDSGPVLFDAHPANILGPGRIDIIAENSAFFLPPDLTDVKEETLNLREYQTGRSPRHKELLTRGKLNPSSIPWIQNRSHVVAQEFLRSEGLIKPGEECEASKEYHEYWPEPKQHPYKSDAI